MSTGQLICHDIVKGLLAYAQERAALATETAERFRSTAAAAAEMPDDLQAQQHTASKGKARATSSQLAVREPSCAPGAVDDEAKGCWQRGICWQAQHALMTGAACLKHVILTVAMALSTSMRMMLVLSWKAR